MKNQTRINQLLTVLLLLCVLFVCMAGTAMAEDCAHVFADGKCTACGVTGGYCGAEPDEGDEEGDEGGAESVWWTLTDSNSVLTIGGTGAMADYDIYIDRPWNASAGSVTSLSIEEGVTRIGEDAFVFFEGIESVTIPASVQSLGYRAFGDCAALKTVTFAQGSELTTIDYSAFQNCDALPQITLPAGVESFDPIDTFSGCSSLTDIHVAEGNATYKSVDGVLYTADGTTLVLYPAGKTATSFTTPAGVTAIGQEAFSEHWHIESIILSKGVTTIGDYAFQSCRALNKVTIPASVTSIGTDAFYDCDSLATVNVPCNWDGTLYSFADTVTVKITTRKDDSIDNGDGTHDVVCTTCGYVHVENEPHTYNQYGICVCKAVKTYTVTFNPDGDSGAKIVEINDEAKEILHGGTFTVPHGQELTVKFANTVSQKEKGVYFNGYVTIDENPVSCAYDEATNTLTIPAVNQDLYVYALAYVRVQFNLHGGTLTEDGERIFNRFGCAWDEETATLKVYYSRLLGLEPEYFQLDGHTFAGAIVDGSDVVETVALEITGDATVDILWNCTDTTTTLTPVPAKDATCMKAGNIAHYVCTCGKLYAEDKTTVLTPDEVKTDVDPTAHSMDAATGECEHCGEFVAVAQVDDAYFTDFGTAITAWQVPEAVKLTLHANVETSARVVFTSDHGDTKVLDLNGCTWTNNNAQVLSNQNRSGMLTIQDSTNAGGAIVCGKSSTSVISNDGTLNITGGTIAATEDYTNVIDNWGTAHISGNAVLKNSCQQAACISNSTMASNAVLTITGDAKIEAGNVAIGLSGTVDLSSAKCAGWVVKQNNSGSSLRLPENYVLQMGDKIVTTLANGETGTIVEHKTHDYATPKFDNTHHWDECACGAATEKVNHTFTYTPVTGKEVHIVGCSGCTYTAPEEIPHEFTNGVCVCTAKAVAKVEFEGSTTYYATLGEALTAAKGKNATVTLLTDGEITALTEFYSPSDITLDLNGKTITASGALLVFGDKLTITGNGKYITDGKRGNVITVMNKGTLTIENGTFVDTSSYGVLLQVDGETNIRGGSFTTTGQYSAPISNGGNMMVTGDSTFAGNADRMEFSINGAGTLDLSGVTANMEGWRVDANGTTVTVGDELILPDGYALKVGENFVTTLASGEIGTIVAHTHAYTTPKFDNTHHWDECACGATTEKVNHTFTYTPVTGKEVHIVGCSGCTYTAPEEIPHEFTDGVCVCTAKAVAKVEAGGTATCYTALETALGAAQSGSKVTLLASVELTSEATIPSYVTFDGGEFTLSGQDLLNNGIITGGTFTATVTNWTGDITGGTFDTISYVMGAVSGQISFKTLDINGFTPEIDLSQAVNIVGARVGIITIDLPVSDLKLPDGCALEVAGKIVSILPSAKTGTIVAHEHGYTYTDQGDGTHSGACPCGAITAAEPHTFVQNNAGEWVCECKAKAVAKVDVTFYANFANAVIAWEAESSVTMTLLDDVEYGDIIKLTSGEEKTLDLNGHTLTSTTTANYALTHRAPLTINDSSSDGTGEFVADYVSSIGYLIESNGSEGSLTLNGGTFTTASALYTLGINKTTSMINSDKVKLYNGYYQIFVINLPESLVITGTGCDGWKIKSWVNDAPITIPVGFHLEDENGNQLAANNKLPAGITIIRADHTHSWSYTADDEKDTITATCSGTIGTCPSAEQSITLNAPDAVYSGNPVEAEVTPDGADLTYTLRYTGTDYDSPDAPVNAGDYTVTMTVGDKSVSASFTINPKDISVVQSIQFSLAQTSFVYSGEAPALNVTGVDSSVGNYTMQENTDYTVGTVQVNAGSHKLTVTGMGNYTGSVELDYEITRAPIDAAVIAAEAQVYTGEALEPAFTVTLDGKTLKHNVDFTYNWTNNVNVGEGKIVINGIGNYEGQAEGTFAIAMADAALSVQTDKDFYTYGETVTVTASRAAKPATFALRSAIAPDQMALFLGDTQIGEAVDAVDGTYTMTVNTADKELSIGENTLRVVYVSDGNLKDAEAPVTVLLLPKELTIINAGAADRVYEKGNKLVDVTGVDLDGIVGIGDDVKADLTGVQGTLPSDNAGTYTTMALPRLTLTGNDSAYYTIAADDAVTTSVEITPKEITSPTIVLDASSFVYDGTEKKPAVTSVKDGDDLIDAAEYTVSYANNIEMGTATVTLTDVAGGNYTVSGSTTFQITQSGTAMTATADKTSYTYGETITVNGTVKATGTAPATTLTLRSAPAAQQVALFAADGTQLTDPVNVVDGAYTLTYNTADKGILPAASITLTVKFVGDDNMADQSAAVTVTLTAKSIEPVLSGSTSKVYDGIDTVTDAGNLTINLNGIIAGDTVSATAAGYAYADETVGQSKAVTANGIALSGADSIFYTLAQTKASAQIGEIKKAMLIGLTEPADTTLDVYCADADAVIGKLPDTVVYHLADGKAVDLKVEWSCTAYDSMPGATNTFAWAINDSEKLACYEIAQNVADDGTIIVTNSAFLPVTVTGTDTAITYNGTAYDVTQMFAIDSNAGAAVFEIIGGGTGEGTLNGSVLNITKAGTITIKVTTALNAAYAAGEATAVLTISKGTPVVTVPTGLTAWYGQKLSDIALPTVDGGAWSWTDMNSTVGNSGVQTHQGTFTPADTNLWNITTHPVNITVAQAGTSFGEMKVYNGNAETTTFTYGETITVKATATAVQPAAFSLRSLIAPTKHQMALFIRNADGAEVQISEAVNEQNGVYTMTYNTTGKALSIGDNALIAKFVGDENMADYQETVLVTLNPKELTIASLTAQDRVYEPGNQQVAITGTEVSGKADANDDVSVLIDGMTATINSENVGTYDTALIPQDVSLTGNHAGYYFARGNVSVSIPQGVEITQATPYTTSGAPAQPVFDPIYQDGQTLGDIPVSLPAGTFNVPGTIEWEAPGDTPVTEGTPFTWVFTPDDPNWKPVTGTVVIYPDGEPPVITAPAGDQEVTVYEGEQGTMAIAAEDATSYQWYINRYDGLGYVPISGATSASYTTSVVNLGNDGFTYYCVASNAYGDTESPVFLLQVLEKIEVPETGDESNIALWTALAILSFAGLTIITMNGRRSKITR